MKPLPKDFPLDRATAFCDGVFAIVITLLVLGISVPEQGDPSGDALLAARSEFWHEVLVYFVGFWFVALYWSQHSLLLAAVQRVDRGLIVLNLSFLVPVTLLPFVTQLMGARQDEWEVVLLFAFTNLVAAFLFRGMWRRIEDRPESHKSTATAALAERTRQGMRLFFAVMILGVLVALYNVKAGVVLFLVVPLFYFYSYVRDPLGSD